MTDGDPSVDDVCPFTDAEMKVYRWFSEKFGFHATQNSGNIGKLLVFHLHPLD